MTFLVSRRIDIFTLPAFKTFYISIIQPNSWNMILYNSIQVIFKHDEKHCIMIRVIMFILPESSSFWNFTISLSANIVQFSLYKMFNSSVIFHSLFTVLARNSFAIRSWRFSWTPKLKTMDFPSRPSIALESLLATSFWEPKKVFPQFEWRRNVVEDVMGPKIIQSWLRICVQRVANYGE